MNFDHDIGQISVIQTIDTSTTPPGGGTAGVLTITGTGAIILPTGTAAQQPTGVAGMLRFNSDSSSFEGWNGTTWKNLGSGGTVTSVAVTGSTGLSVSGSPITTSGTISLTLGTELQGVSSLATNGLVTRTAAGTYAGRTITGTAGNIAVTNGDGVAGNPTINLSTVGTSVSNQFVKITTDSFGRVSATSAVAASDITALVDGTYVNVTGDTMSGNLTFSSGTVTGLSTPVNPTDAANKQYVDAAITGLDFKQSVKYATAAALPANTASGSGAGKTLTGNANGVLSVDSTTVSVNDRILVKNEVAGANNGIYVVTSTGSGGSPYVLTRATDSDNATEMNYGEFCFVESGATLASTGWVLSTAGTITLETTSLTYIQFSGNGLYVAGTGISISGNTISLSTPVSTSNGGTGLSSIGGANTILGVNSGASGLEYKTLSQGTGISISNSANTITIANTGVTSVGLSAPAALFTTSGSPVTTTGTLTLSLATQNNNTFFAGPATGGPLAPTWRTIGYTDLPIGLYAENKSSPTAPVATGANAVAIGSGSSSTGTATVAIGDGTSQAIFGGKALANGRIGTAGDAQTGTYILRNSTSTAAATELFLDGLAGTQRLVLPNNSAWTFCIYVIARRTDATGGAASYKFEGGILKNATASSIAFIGTPSKSVLGETNTAWDVAVSADTTNGSLRLIVTGEATKTIKWVATVITTETVN